MYLGNPLPLPVSKELLEKRETWHDVLLQHHNWYISLRGEQLIGEVQVNEIIKLLKNGSLYAGSNGVVKDGYRSHVYGFTRSNGK